MPLQPLAFIGLVTAGCDPHEHDILELAVVRVDARSLTVLAEHSTLVAPERLAQATGEALALAGYSKEGWLEAVPLRYALQAASPLLEGAVVAGHDVGLDWRFLEAGCRRAGLMLSGVQHHLVDTASLAWPLAAAGVIPSTSLDAVASHLGISRPRPHRALGDARCALEIARRLARRLQLGDRMTKLGPNERRLADVFLTRLEHRTRAHGPWQLGGGDALLLAAEDGLAALDLAAVGAAREARARVRRRRVYVCHPFAGDPVGNVASLRGISQRLLAEGVLPIAPPLYLHPLLPGAAGRDEMDALSLELLAICDEVRVFGDVVTEGMERELREARQLGISARFVREVFA